MLVVSSGEFREKQAEYLNRVDNGEQIIVQRGKNKAYAITPVKSADLYVSKNDAKSFIKGDELLERLIPRIKALFEEE